MAVLLYAAMRLALAVGLLLPIAACDCGGRRQDAATVAPDKPVERPGDRFRAALGVARRHELKRDFAAAIASYREALAIWPASPRVLDSIAKAELAAGDAAAARRSIDQAAAIAVDNKTRALIAWTDGEVAKAEGDPVRAARALRRSHDLLPRTETRTALGKQLERPTLGSLSPLPLDGPYADLPAACAALRPTSPATDWACDPDKGAELGGPNKVDPVTGPFRSAWIFEAGSAARPDCVLALKVDEKWWTLELAPGCRGEGITVRSNHLAVTVPAGGGQPTLYVEQAVTAHWKEIAHDGAEAEVDDADVFVVRCGVGPSRRPSCTPHIPRASKRTMIRDGATDVHEPALAYSIGEGDAVVLASEEPRRLEGTVRDLLGVHPMEWP